MLQQLANLLPASQTKRIAKLMEQGGIVEFTAKTYLGGVFVLAAAAGIIALLAMAIGAPQFGWPGAIVVGIVGAALVYAVSEGYLYTRADDRAARIEEVLADALRLIAANIRAGMTLENALWTSARPEFGPLSDEIKKVSAETLGGKPVSDALRLMPERVRSNLAKRAVELVVEGVRLGGEMAPLLDAVARDIQVQQSMRREVVSSTTTYAIFIVFAAVLIAPLLFGVSVFYGEVNERIVKKIQPTSDLGENAAAPSIPIVGFRSGGSRNALPSDQLRWFAIAAVTITSAFSAIILGAIRTGKALRGVWNAPLFAVISLGVFFGALQVIRIAFGGITG